jgi:hypothetical protein
LIKVWFRFVPREGWLPYDSEGLWARRLSGDTARVENVPFLQDGVADEEGLHWARGRGGGVGQLHCASQRLGPHAADDICAETFALAFRQRHRYDLSRGSARPWPYGIATNVISRHRRDEVRLLRAVNRLRPVSGTPAVMRTR